MLFRSMLLCLSVLGFTLATVSATYAQATHSVATKTPARPCGTAAPGNYLLLNGGSIGSGMVVYHGRILMWPPIDNTTACSIRQLVFNVPDNMVDGLGTDGSPDAPTVQLTVESNHSVAASVTPSVFSIQRVQNGPGLIEYTVDAQSAQPVAGDVYLNITITGIAKPVPAK